MKHLNKITSAKDTYRLDATSKMLLPTSSFTKELELQKLRSEIRPRKYNHMAAHDRAILECDSEELVEEAKRIFFPCTAPKAQQSIGKK